jgi:hypothetical protein
MIGVLVLVSCTGAPNPVPAPTLTTMAPTAAASHEQGPISEDLEGWLPEQVGSIRLTKSSTTIDFDLQNAVDSEISEFLADVGVTRGQMSNAQAVGFSRQTGETVTAAAWQVTGAREDALQAATQAMLERTGEGYVFVPARVSGRDGFEAQAAAEPALHAFVYARGDVVFAVFGSNPSLVEDAVAQMPE